MVWNGRINTLDHLLVERLHVGSLERRLKGGHLIHHTSERPDVGLAAVRLVLPHLRTGVVRSAGLSVVQSEMIGYFGDVTVSEFCHNLIRSPDSLG